MPPHNTPPNSPVLSDEDLPHQFDENDILEVYEVNEEDLEEELQTDDAEYGSDSDNSEAKPERDDSRLTFTKHTAGVLSCAFHPRSPNVVVTGGMDDKAYVWDTSNGNVLLDCIGHEDSVEAVAFSHDGSYVATGDLIGCINVWKTSDYKLTVTLELGDELSWLTWHHGTNVLLAAAQNGTVYMYKIPSGETRVVASSFGQVCTVGKVLPDGKRLLCGYKDGSLKVVDLKAATTIHHMKPPGEPSTVTCIDVHRDNNLAICGCENGGVMLINTQAGKIASVLVHGTSHEVYIEAAAVCRDGSLPLAASGSMDGSLTVWDLARQTQRYRVWAPSCVGHLAWHPTLPLVFTSHGDGSTRVLDARTGTVVRTFLGHCKCNLSMALSPDGQTLMTTSEDKTVKIFNIDIT